MSKIRTITYLEGKRQSGVTTLLLRKSMNYMEKKQSVLFVASNRRDADNLTKRLGGFLGPVTTTYSVVVENELTKQNLENVEAVFINDYDRTRFDVESLHVMYPRVDFYMGTTIDDLY